jgi:SPP1 family predicted phage head-tail adaptor
MKVGKLRKRLTIQRNESASRNASGEPVPNWVDVARVWGGLEPLSGREMFNGVQVQADATHKITLRYRGDIELTADMRLVLGARVFHLAGPPRNVEERGAAWEMDAIEQGKNT